LTQDWVERDHGFAQSHDVMGFGGAAYVYSIAQGAQLGGKISVKLA
jgi:hypothetical protein